MNEAREGFGVAVIDDKILVLGGYGYHRATSKCELFDDLEKKWTETKDMLSPRHGHSAITLDHFSLNYEDF